MANMKNFNHVEIGGRAEEGVRRKKNKRDKGGGVGRKHWVRG